MKQKKKKDLPASQLLGWPWNMKHLKCFLLAIVQALLVTYSDAASCTAGFYDTGDTYCTPCQVGKYCTGGNSNNCGNYEYSSTRASGCTSYTYGTIVAGQHFDCPPDTYRGSEGVCTDCTNGYSCDGSTRSACSGSGANYEISEDGTCFSCPSGFECANRNLDNASPADPGYYISNNNAYQWQNGYYCINGQRTSCPTGTWALTGYTGCNYCPPNHYCNWDPATCGNGQYLPTLTSTSCSTCTAGYFCKKDWVGRVKVYPGTYAGTGSTTSNECPNSKSCSE